MWWWRDGRNVIQLKAFRASAPPSLFCKPFPSPFRCASKDLVPLELPANLQQKQGQGCSNYPWDLTRPSDGVPRAPMMEGWGPSPCIPAGAVWYYMLGDGCISEI